MIEILTQVFFGSSDNFLKRGAQLLIAHPISDDFEFQNHLGKFIENITIVTLCNIFIFASFSTLMIALVIVNVITLSATN